MKNLVSSPPHKQKTMRSLPAFWQEIGASWLLLLGDNLFVMLNLHGSDVMLVMPITDVNCIVIKF